MSDTEELDYDDPRLLASLSASSAPAAADLSYADRRKRKLAAQSDRSRAGNTKSRKQAEEDARREGLETNLIVRDKLAGEDSKGLKMMRAMGFTPGEALGKKPEERAESPVVVAPSASSTSTEEEPPRARGGLGFARASFNPIGAAPSQSAAAAEKAMEQAKPEEKKADGPRTEPIRISMRLGRTGLGIPQPRPARIPPSLLPLDSSTTPLPDLEGYLSHLKSSMDARRAYGVLRSARRTLEELDRRNGVEDSCMWRDPEEESREKERFERRKLFDRVDDELDSDDERKAGREDGKAKGGKKGKGKGGLEYEQGMSGTVVDLEEERGMGKDEEEEEWMAMDVQTRLGLTLTYLRTKYNYCLWCGCQYDSPEDLAENCPGEAEEDH
ncbi:hypothetical protein JCM10213v2_004209 [Rhodosporidiobolus nylandii]